MLSHSVRYQEFLVHWPTIVLLRETNLLFSKRLTVGSTRILFMRRSVTNMAIHNDQRGPILRPLKDPQSSLQHLHVIDIAHARHIPAISDEARGHILTKGQTCRAFNANAVVIVDPAEVGEF